MMRELPWILGLAGWLVIPAAGEPESDFHMYMKGRWVYERSCAVCHGARGKGDGEWAHGVDDRPRDFRSGVFKFTSTPPGKLPTDEDLERTIRGGVSGTMMPAFKKLTDKEVAAVIHYLKGFSRRWRDPELVAEPLPLPEAPEWLDDAEERAARARAGGERFALHCASCHGAEGRGDGPAARGLQDHWGDPIRPADLSEPFHKSGPAPEDLFRTVSCGLDGTPMPGFGAAMKPAERWELVAYILELERPEGE